MSKHNVPMIHLDDAAWGIVTLEDGAIVEADTGALIVPPGAQFIGVVVVDGEQLAHYRGVLL